MVEGNKHSSLTNPARSLATEDAHRDFVANGLTVKGYTTIHPPPPNVHKLTCQVAVPLLIINIGGYSEGDILRMGLNRVPFVNHLALLCKKCRKKYEQISGKKSFSYCKMMMMTVIIIIIIIIMIIIFTIFNFQWI